MFVLFRHRKLKTSLGGWGEGGTYTSHTGMCRPIAEFLLHKTKLNARLALRQRAFWSENGYRLCQADFTVGNIGFSFTNISEGTAFLQGLTYDNIGKRKIYIPHCKISLASFVSIYPIIADQILYQGSVLLFWKLVLAFKIEQTLLNLVWHRVWFSRELRECIERIDPFNSK